MDPRIRAIELKRKSIEALAMERFRNPDSGVYHDQFAYQKMVKAARDHEFKEKGEVLEEIRKEREARVRERNKRLGIKPKTKIVKKRKSLFKRIFW